jgi:hypothetical protein
VTLREAVKNKFASPALLDRSGEPGRDLDRPTLESETICGGQRDAAEREQK